MKTQDIKVRTVRFIEPDSGLVQSGILLMLHKDQTSAIVSVITGNNREVGDLYKVAQKSSSSMPMFEERLDHLPENLDESWVPIFIEYGKQLHA